MEAEIEEVKETKTQDFTGFAEDPADDPNVCISCQ